jgi:hypothetical protein
MPMLSGVGFGDRPSSTPAPSWPPKDASELPYGVVPPFLVAIPPHKRPSPLTTPPGRKIFFITYGSGMFVGAAKRLVEQARSMDVFTSLRAYVFEDMDGDFVQRHRSIIRLTRGGGYWIWKPYFIHRVMESEMADGDILVYADGGCHMNPEGRERLLQYFSMLDADPVQCGSVAFQLGLKELMYTKREVLEHFNVTVPDTLLSAWQRVQDLRKAALARDVEVGGNALKARDAEAVRIASLIDNAAPFPIDDSTVGSVLGTGQYVGGIQILKKTPLSMDLVQRWFHAVDDKILLISDPGKGGAQEYQLPGYRTHRHEQSVLSILRKVLGPHRTISLPDETYFKHLGRGTAGWDTHRHFPIHARRTRG